MTKIAIASCCKIEGKYHVKNQTAWREIEDETPDILLLLGDNVYMKQSRPRWNFPHLEEQYKKQFKEPHFYSLINKVPFMATWDDHDFGPNNSRGATSDGIKGGRRDKSRKLFHKYMKDSINDNRPEVYCTHIINNIKIIMLDVRYYRNAAGRRNSTILGDNQEKWLKKELDHKHKFTIVCSGVGFGEKNRGNRDDWSAYEYASKRLEAELNKIPKLFFVAGDIHSNKFKKHGKFYEVHSSGVGRKHRGDRKPLNNYGIIDYGSNSVKISLKGRNKINKEIRISDWKLI
ncbi:alkaline phosphatase D family protein [Fulvivirgaceae bacterium BMA12]|uniref:Alkaline phosphatase D family protein n=1 Tax=Agaribacillus aureus TaxID=3051825 RepID=A0ABT8L682_9BACT|nr:alkaline phosphatase D family protein [Fulvivirgaceae bacterium BMA12]